MDSLQQVNWPGGARGLKNDLVAASPGEGLDLTNFLDAAIVNDSGTIGMVTLPNAVFTTIVLTTRRTDTPANYNTSDGIYTVPVTGMYSIQARLRVKDNTGAGLNLGMGVHFSTTDGDWFHWNIIPTGLRKSFLYVRKGRFNAGDPLRLYAYASGSVEIANANMTIEPHGGF